jgi:hypothetical protein
MQRMIRKSAEMVLFVLLVVVVAGIWACLWLPPF